MKIATFNVNSIKIRLGALLAWLKEAGPDIACLQEIKTLEPGFPVSAIEDAGYHAAIFGQKAYNGVAILSKRPLEDVRRGLPGLGGDEARYIEAVVSREGGGVLRIASIYVPNGNPAPGPKYDAKLAFLDALAGHVRALLALEEPLALAGDYNVIPEPRDVHDPDAWRMDALFLPASRARLRALLHLGLTDAYRACHAEGGAYTFWDYQGGAFAKNHGIRIDHLLLSPQAADRLSGAGIDRHLRAAEGPSDHVPLWCTLDL